MTDALLFSLHVMLVVDVDQNLYAHTSADSMDDTTIVTWNSPGSVRCHFFIEHVGNGVFTMRSRYDGKLRCPAFW